MLPSTSAEVLTTHLTHDYKKNTMNSNAKNAISPSTSFMSGIRKVDNSASSRSNNLLVTPKSTTTGDRITRYASPNRYDSLDTPHSFLDSRSANKNRNVTRLNIDRITSKATPERSLSHDQMVECSVPQPYQTSGSAVLTPRRVITTRSLPTRRPPLTPLRGSSHDGVLDTSAEKDSQSNNPTRRLNSLEARLQGVREQNVPHQEIKKTPLDQHPMFSDRTSPNPTVFQKLFNQPHYSRPLSQPEESQADIAVWTSRQASSLSDQQDPPLNFAPLSVETETQNQSSGKQSKSLSSVSPRGKHSTPLPSISQKPEITKIDSKVHTRVFIQSDATTQSKTLTYNGSCTPSKIYTGDTSANANLDSSFNKVFDDNDEDDPELTSKLDAIATHLGLLEGKPGSGPTLSHSQIGVSNSYKVTSTTSAEFGVEKDKLSAARKMSDAAIHEDTGSSKEGSTLSKRGRTSLIRSILKRFSPRTKYRSKSSSPSRDWIVKDPKSATSSNSQDVMQKSSSTGQDERISGDTPSKSSTTSGAPQYKKSGNKIKRFFTKRLTKKEQQEKSSGGNKSKSNGDDIDSCDIQPEAASCPGYLGEQASLPTSRTYCVDSTSNDETIVLEITDSARIETDAMGSHHTKQKNKQISSKSANLSSDTKDIDATREITNSHQNIASPSNNVKGNVQINGDSESQPDELSSDNIATPGSTENNEEGKSRMNQLDSPSNHSKANPSEPQSFDDMLSSSVMTGSNIQHESIAEETEDDTDKEKTSSTDESPTDQHPHQPNVVMRRSVALSDDKVKSDGPSSSSPRETKEARSLMTTSFYQRQCSNKDEDLASVKRKRNRSSSDDKQRSSRSSLIILTVSKCSPRSKTLSHVQIPTLPGNQKTNASPSAPKTSPTSLSISGSPFDRNALSLANTPIDYRPNLSEQDNPCNESATPSNQKSSSNAVDKMEISSDEVFSESQTKPSGDGEEKSNSGSMKEMLPGGLTSAKEKENDEEDSARGGEKFLQITDEIETELRSSIEQTEKYLSESQHLMSDEVCGHLRSAAGKGYLLVNDKLAQFRGLCEQNIAHQRESQENKDEEASYATLASDLEGFWAMVTLQIEDVKRTFAHIEEMRGNNWQIPQEAESASSFHPKTATRRVGPSSRPTKKAASAPNKEAEKARLEARKRIQTARREALAKMKQQQLEQQQTNGGDSDQLCVIFA